MSRIITGLGMVFLVVGVGCATNRPRLENDDRAAAFAHSEGVVRNCYSPVVARDLELLGNEARRELAQARPDTDWQTLVASSALCQACDMGDKQSRAHAALLDAIHSATPPWQFIAALSKCDRFTLGRKLKELAAKGVASDATLSQEQLLAIVSADPDGPMALAAARRVDESHHTKLYGVCRSQKSSAVCTAVLDAAPARRAACARLEAPDLDQNEHSALASALSSWASNTEEDFTSDAATSSCAFRVAPGSTYRSVCAMSERLRLRPGQSATIKQQFAVTEADLRWGLTRPDRISYHGGYFGLLVEQNKLTPDELVGFLSAHPSISIQAQEALKARHDLRPADLISRLRAATTKAQARRLLDLLTARFPKWTTQPGVPGTLKPILALKAKHDRHAQRMLGYYDSLRGAPSPRPSSTLSGPLAEQQQRFEEANRHLGEGRRSVQLMQRLTPKANQEIQQLERQDEALDKQMAAAVSREQDEGWRRVLTWLYVEGDSSSAE